MTKYWSWEVSNGRAVFQETSKYCLTSDRVENVNTGELSDSLTTVHPHMWQYILVSLTLSQLQATCRHWADHRCHSSYKHELIWLWRNHKSLSGHSWGSPVHLLRAPERSNNWEKLQPQPDCELCMEIPSPLFSQCGSSNELVLFAD